MAVGVSDQVAPESTAPVSGSVLLGKSTLIIGVEVVFPAGLQLRAQLTTSCIGPSYLTLRLLLEEAGSFSVRASTMISAVSGRSLADLATFPPDEENRRR
jgi:hypothetical protein